MGFERNYPVRILSNQLKNYSTHSLDNLLNPGFVTGFTDAEGSFMISVLKRSDTVTG
jgi:hypothetical protein